jgi:serine/threonine-protein kinase
VSHLTLVDQAGRAEPIALPSRSYDNLRLSPDGQRIAVGVEDNGRLDVWLYDIPRATWSRLTFSGNNSVPIWTSDGKRVAFISDRDGKPKMYWKAADGTGSEELLSTEAGNPHSWSPDGRFVARTFNFGRASGEIGILSLDDRRTRPFLSTPEGNEIAAPAFSPDGRWLAYVSNETGRRQVYVRAFPTGEGRWLISSDGGIQPMWARSGRELFYRNAEKMMAVHVSADPVFRADSPRLLFEGQYEGPAVRADYDVTPDGRFVMIKADQQSSLNRQLNVVVNWTEELKRLVPTQ